MKLSVDFSPDLVALLEQEIKAGERAVTAAMRQAGGDLKAGWRRQITGAGLGQRLARSIRNKTYPERGESLDAAAFIWSKAPKIIHAHDRGVLIRSKNGFYLAIPTEAAGKGRGGARLAACVMSFMRASLCSAVLQRPQSTVRDDEERRCWLARKRGHLKSGPQGSDARHRPNPVLRQGSDWEQSSRAEIHKGLG